MAGDGASSSVVGLLQQLAGGGPIREVLTEITDMLVQVFDCERIFPLQMRKRGGFHVVVARSHDREDILLLAGYFLDDHARKDGGDPPELTDSARLKLLHYAWPGNVRELENEMRRVIALKRTTVRAEHISLSLRGRRRAPEASCSRAHESEATLREAVEAAERETVLNAPQTSRWNKSRAAVQLEITRRSLYRRMAKYGITEGSG